MLQPKIGMDPEYITIFMFLTNYSLPISYAVCASQIARLFQTLGKQRSPISIVHRSPVNALGDRQDAITGYSPYCIVGTFGLMRM